MSRLFLNLFRQPLHKTIMSNISYHHEILSKDKLNLAGGVKNIRL